MPTSFQTKLSDPVKVLIVEDEPLIAWDLLSAVEEAGGAVIGPAATVRSALELAQAQLIDAAILDHSLIDGHSGPVLDALRERAVPVVMHTGEQLPPELLARHPRLRVLMKPTPSALLARLVLNSASSCAAERLREAARRGR